MKSIVTRSAVAAGFAALLVFAGHSAFAQDADAPAADTPAESQPVTPANPTYGGAIAPASPDMQSAAPAADQNAGGQDAGQPTEQPSGQTSGQAAGMAAGALQKLNNMTPEQRAQLLQQGTAAVQGVSAQNLDAMKAKLSAEWQAATPEQQQQIQAQLLQSSSLGSVQQQILDHMSNASPEQKQIVIDSFKKAEAAGGQGGAAPTPPAQ